MLLGNLRSGLGLAGKTRWVLEQGWGGERCRERGAGASWVFGTLLVGKRESVADVSLEVEAENGGGGLCKNLSCLNLQMDLHPSPPYPDLLRHVSRFPMPCGLGWVQPVRILAGDQRAEDREV